MTRTIHLMGRMGQLFGTTHRLNCDTVQEAMHALDCMKGGVRRYLLECTDNGVHFTVKNADEFLDMDNIGNELEEGDIIISPVPAGANLKKIIIGVLLIVGSIFIPGFKEAAAGTWKAYAAAAMFSAGVSLALMGIIEMTMDDPDELDEEKSTLFNGPINTTKMGVPVPICYGKMEVGGAVTNFGFTQSRVKGQMGYTFVSKPSTATTGTSSTGGTGTGGTGGGALNWVKQQVRV